MVVFIPRIRTINVRLSEAEYLELERLCLVKGARSISDFVRNSVREQVAVANQDRALASTVNQHEALVKELEQKIERLSAEIASLRADTPIRQIEGDAQPACSADGVDTQSAIDRKELLSSRAGGPAQSDPGSHSK